LAYCLFASESLEIVLTQSSEKLELPAVIVAVVCTVVIATHWPALSAKAVSFDDQQYMVDNPLVQNPGWPSAKRFLTEILEPSTVNGYYQPLAMISLMLDYAAGGNEKNLRPFHITSLALHTANTALIIVLLYMLFGNIWAAAAAGLLFGVHPMTVEPIPWVGERKTLLAAFFAFWSLIFYVRYSRSGNWKSSVGCFLMYLLALMSKPTSIPLPAVMLSMDYWPLKKISVKSLLEKVPLFILGAIFAVITYISQHRTAGTVAPTEFGPGHILLVLCHNIIFYLFKIILPINLSSHYAFPKPFGLSSPMVLAGVIGTCILIAILLVSLRWTKAAMTGWLIFFVAIFPTMGTVGFTNVIASDKFAYLPSVGLLMILTSFLIWLGKNTKVKVAAAIAVLLLASAEAAATQRYLEYWQDSITLINHMLVLAPDAAPLYNSRGSAYHDRGDLDQAIADYTKAIEIDPLNVEGYINRGAAHLSKNQMDLAISDYNKSIEISPRYAEAYNNRGLVYMSKGQLDQAISDFNKSIEINPRYAIAYNNRGSAYKSKGQLDRAISDFNKAVEIKPKLFGTYLNKAGACESAGRKTEAAEAYRAFIKYAPAQQYASQIEQAKQKIRQLEQ
jgi:tetratricopeptide (TPR) repeat protein